MTVDEAVKKWCPFARVWPGGGPSVNRTAQGEPAIGTRCISGRCMAWRWEWVGGLSSTDGDCGMKA